MENFFKLITTQINDFWGRLDNPSRRRLIISAVLILVVIFTLSWAATRKEYTVLYSNLNSKDAGEILNKLGEMKVDVKPEGNGTILVPKSQEAKLRMQLAAEGYPKTGFNYDYFKGGLGLGATDFDKRKADQLQLQERIQTAIKTMGGVQDAIVTISIPEQDSFVLQSDKQSTTAAVLLSLSSTLTKKQIKGIEELVAKSVLGLKAENISIVDSNMNALNVQDSSETGNVGTHFDMENQVRDSLQKQIYALLDPVFGKGNVIPSVNVKLNFDKQITEKITFLPVADDTGIAVSLNELKEKVNNGTSTDTTGQTTYPAGQSGADQGGYDKSNKTINYEVNKVKDQIEKAQGVVEKLTLSILINKSPLDDKTLASIQKIVSTAVGVEPDKIVVQGMAFDGKVAEKTEADKLKTTAQKSETTQQYIEYAKYAGYALAVFFVLFMIYRFISKLKLAVRELPRTVGVGAGSGTGSATATADFANMHNVPTKFVEDIIEMPEEDKEQIIKKQRMDNIIDSKPEIVVQQLREWLNEN
ncbi:MAG: flagellar M-ring protein FliF [Hyphomonadaceae bacterium]|nr:flagellar M-ring protein FliF [Clostridia bacterium]